MNIFISCERIDEQYPQELIKKLSYKGHKVRTSPKNPLDGEDPKWQDWYNTGLPETLGGSDVFISVITDSWDSSTWMAQESDLAEKYLKTNKLNKMYYIDLRKTRRNLTAEGMKNYLKEELMQEIEELIKTIT